MPTREDIKPQVIHKLEIKTNEKDIKESDDLTNDLNMTDTGKESMSEPYSRITKKYDGKSISTIEAKKLKSVKESIDLVHKKSNKKMERK